MPASVPRSNVDSPCVRDCCLDDADVCIGCGRTLDEILRWRASSETERAEILASAQQRIKQRLAP